MVLCSVKEIKPANPVKFHFYFGGALLLLSVKSPFLWCGSFGQIVLPELPGRFRPYQ